MSTAERIPNSVLKVKAWYDAGFLEPEQITSHDNAKKFITATMAYVNHFICSPTLGTAIQTEVSIFATYILKIVLIGNYIDRFALNCILIMYYFL